MKINRQAFVRHNTPIYQPKADRQASLNKGNYKLKDWQRRMQQQQQSAVQPEANRPQSAETRHALPNNAISYKSEAWQKIMQQQQQSAAQPKINRSYRSGRGFSEYSMPGKLLFATALLSTLTAGKSEAMAPPATHSLCTKKEIFELFNIDGSQKQEPQYFQLFPEPGSMAAALEDYIGSKTPQSNDQIVKKLLSENYLTYPGHLDLKYRVVNHSPGEMQIAPQPCPANTVITPNLIYMKRIRMRLLRLNYRSIPVTTQMQYTVLPKNL